MYIDSYKCLLETLQKSFSSIVTMHLELTQMSFDALKESFDELAHIISSCYTTEYLSASLLHLSNFYKDIFSIITNTNIPTIPNDAFDFLNEIDFQNEYIELTENDCYSINALFNFVDLECPVKPVPHNKTSSIQFALTILIPIIIGFLQLAQNAYYHHQDSFETQNTQILEQEYYEQLLQIHTEIQNTLNDFRKSQESRPCNCADAPAPQSEEFTDVQDNQSHVVPAEYSEPCN